MAAHGIRGSGNMLSRSGSRAAASRKVGIWMEHSNGRETLSRELRTLRDLLGRRFTETALVVMANEVLNADHREELRRIHAARTAAGLPPARPKPLPAPIKTRRAINNWINKGTVPKWPHLWAVVRVIHRELLPPRNPDEGFWKTLHADAIATPRQPRNDPPSPPPPLSPGRQDQIEDEPLPPLPQPVEPAPEPIAPTTHDAAGASKRDRRAAAARQRRLLPPRVVDARARLRQLRFGDVVDGTVTSVQAEGIHLVTSGGIQGFVPCFEINAARDADLRGHLVPGAGITASFLRETDGYVAELSVRRYRCEQIWEQIERLHQIRGIVQGEVIHVAANGLHLAVHGDVRGVLPWAHVLLNDRDEVPALGETVSARVRGANRQRHTVLLTRRRILDYGGVRKAADTYGPEVERAAQQLQAELGDTVELPHMFGDPYVISPDQVADLLPLITPAEVRLLCAAMPQEWSGDVDLEEVVVRLERARQRLLPRSADHRP